MTGENLMTQNIVWSKENCPYCVQAKRLLTLRGVEFEERNISGGSWSKDQLLEMVPMARTVPQIFIGGEHIGGFDALVDYYKTLEQKETK
jgi:glutaredoxin 3